MTGQNSKSNPSAGSKGQEIIFALLFVILTFSF
jgi:hypothetical protein